MHKILLEKLFFQANHGVFEEERLIGGRFEINLEITTDFSRAMKEDSLVNTIDYSAVYSIIEEEMKIPSKLIENVGYRIVSRLKQTFPAIKHTSLKLSKLSPPISGEIGSVSIVIEE